MLALLYPACLAQYPHPQAIHFDLEIAEGKKTK